jgi:hypothetical protein
MKAVIDNNINDNYAGLIAATVVGTVNEINAVRAFDAVDTKIISYAQKNV